MISTLETLATGMLSAAFLVAGVFFLRFWRESRDTFFLAFAASFLMEAANHISIAFLPKPNLGSPWNYLVGLCSSVLILAAIVQKNLRQR